MYNFFSTMEDNDEHSIEESIKKNAFLSSKVNSPSKSCNNQSGRTNLTLGQIKNDSRNCKAIMFVFVVIVFE